MKLESTLNQRFVSEGRFLALPLAFEEENFPIPPDESYITTFTESPCGTKFFGATRGHKCHVFAGITKGSCAGILDLGVIEDAIDIPVIIYLGPAAHEENIHEIIAIANTKDGAKIYCHKCCLPNDSIQEPWFLEFPFLEPYELNKECVTDALLTQDGKHLICLTDNGVCDFDIGSGIIRNVFESCLDKASIRKWALLSDSMAYFIDEHGTFIEFNLNTMEIRQTDISGEFDNNSWGFTIADERIICANGLGEIFAVTPKANSIENIGEAVLPVIQCMTALPDGRIYGVCGSEIGFFFKADLNSGKSEALGAIVAAIGTKRYGFDFSIMTTGKDGEIYLCENDRGGHLWIYFPKIC